MSRAVLDAVDPVTSQRAAGIDVAHVSPSGYAAVIALLDQAADANDPKVAASLMLRAGRAIHSLYRLEHTHEQDSTPGDSGYACYAGYALRVHGVPVIGRGTDVTGSPGGAVGASRQAHHPSTPLSPAQASSAPPALGADDVMPIAVYCLRRSRLRLDAVREALHALEVLEEQAEAHSAACTNGAPSESWKSGHNGVGVATQRQKHPSSKSS